MLAVRLQLDMDSAHTVLRRAALDRGLGTGALASDVVAGAATISLPLPIAAQPPEAAGTG